MSCPRIVARARVCLRQAAAVALQAHRYIPNMGTHSATCPHRRAGLLLATAELTLACVFCVLPMVPKGGTRHGPFTFRRPVPANVTSTSRRR
jgi:hypothetical protein